MKNRCDECGGRVSDPRTSRCIDCVRAESAKRKVCPDCGGPKRTESKRCKNCSYKALTQADESGRVCIDCKEFKPWAHFRDRKGVAGYVNGKMARCDPCYVAKFRQDYLWRVYRLTPEDYDRMVEEQGNSCANDACDRDLPDSRTYWDIDHCHATDVVRELLCTQCNQALGNLEDSPELIAGLQRYALKHRQLRLVAND